MRPAGFIMFAGRTVAGFTADLGCVRAFCLEPCMRGGGKGPGNLSVALFATFRSGECRSFNLRRSDDGSGPGGAGDYGGGGEECADATEGRERMPFNPGDKNRIFPVSQSVH